MTLAFVVGPLVLPTDQNPCIKLQVRRYTPIKSRKIESAIAALTGGRVVSVVSQKFLFNDIHYMYSKPFSNYFKRTLYWVVKTNFFTASEK